MKDESFMQNVNWINSLKLRVSYGTVGNTAISPYQTLASLSQYAYLFSPLGKAAIFHSVILHFHTLMYFLTTLL